MGSDYNQPKRETVTTVIANGETVSSAIDITGKTLIGLIFPTMTRVAMTLQGSIDGTNYKEIKNSSGSALSFTIASNTHIVLSTDNFQNLPATSIKLVATGGAEGAERTITAILKVI